MGAMQQALIGTAGAAPGVTVTWDPANKGYDTALSSGNLVATVGPGSNSGIVRSTLSRSAGKYVVELTPQEHSSDGFMALGLANPAWDATDVLGYLGAYNSYSIGIYTNGSAYRDPSELNDGSTIPDFGTAPTDVLTLALNFDTGKGWMAVNGTFVGDPGGGTGEAFTFTANEEFFVAFSGYGAGGLSDSVRANFGASAFAVTLPSGWSSWDGSQTG